MMRSENHMADSARAGASGSGKDAARVLIFPPAVPLLAIAAAVALRHYWPLVQGVAVPRIWLRWIGGLMAGSALLLLGAWSVYIMRSSGQSENPWKPTTHILERGPFRLTRNPMYLQMIIVCIGVAIALTNLWLLLLTPVCAWLLQRLAIVPEERYLAGKFGEEYLEYQKRVRRWL